MTVKRFTWCGVHGMDVSDTGKYVKFEDYAALLKERDALAADNAGLQSAHPQPFGPEMMKALDTYEKHQDEVPETGMLAAFFILRDSISVQTPATDAAIAEMQAQGVDMAIAQLLKKFGTTGQIGVPVMALEWLAKELRKEAGNGQ